MNDKYTFKDLLKKYNKISIPKIQRDYAQGRKEEKAKDIRENLLNNIFSNEVQSLDFIFGTVCDLPNNSKAFIPLDGQQRLTTLFLLYLYGIKNDKLKINGLSNFTYETRKAASDFCKAIVDNEWPTLDDNMTLSKAIVKQKWFMNYWLNDPTVEGMLTMLDAIHEKATNNEKNYPNLDNITFRFFDMNEHNLSDNLYIKMNSRGKPLTTFENLKASIDRILPDTTRVDSFKWLEIDDVALKSKKNFREQWMYCIDRKWTDMFWSYKENYLSDPPFMRFIANILSAYWINKESIQANDDGEKNKLLRFFLGITGKEDYLSFDNFREILPTTGLEKEEGKHDNETLKFLADCLNSFYLILKFEDNLAEICRPSWGEPDYDLIKRALQINPSYKERAMFYALIKCPYISEISSNKDEAKQKIKQWMRVFWNIVEQEQERIRNFIGAAHLVNEISRGIINKNNKDIYEWLSDEQNTIISGFMKNQVEEERAKAKQIQRNKENSNTGFSEDDIVYAERHPLLKGCISSVFENDKCENVSFGKRISDRVDLLNDLWNKDNEKDYSLVKVLISWYDKEKPESKLYLKKNLENWKILVTDKLKDCFRKNENNTFNQICQGWESMIANTQLIDNSRDDGKIIGVYWNGKIILWATGGCTWNANGNVILDKMHNNCILSELLENKTIECIQKIPNCPFFAGLDINFKYFRGNKCFELQWNTDGHVYLIENNERKKNFSVEGIEEVGVFEESLKTLIEELSEQ